MVLWGFIQFREVESFFEEVILELRLKGRMGGVEGWGEYLGRLMSV